MDVVVNGHHCTVSQEVKDHVIERFESIEKLRDRVIRADVEFTNEEQKGNPNDNMKCQITLRSRGPVVRAEAFADDKLAAFEKAFDKLRSQVRKAADRRKNHRGLRWMNPDIPTPLDVPAPESAEDEVPRSMIGDLEVTGDGPLVVREKEFPGTPLTLAQALDEMELVGHDFFLYVDKDTSRPSVVYRRKGYNYGVIHLTVDA